MSFDLNDKGEKVDIYFNLLKKTGGNGPRTKSGIVDFGKNNPS